jgi:purine-nucleoside phosphorylase
MITPVEKTYSLQELDEIVTTIRQKTAFKPRIGLILGSGLGDLVNSVREETALVYTDLPGWPASTVEGHKGKMVFGTLQDQPVLVLQGRVHYYEGYSMGQVTLSVRVMQRLGIDTLILTNAAGAINPDYAPGDLMLLIDHLSLLVMGGENPLRGPNLDEIGPRFPDMSATYDHHLLDLARQAATEKGIAVREGVYAALAGPSFETPADLRFLRLIGADAVGMSTVPEAIVARHGGMKVLGVSGISNKANLDGKTVTTHQEVLAAGKTIVPKLTAIIQGVLSRL